MKLGLGLYRHMLTTENLRFARQAGATHVVAHLVDYFSAGPRIPASVSSSSGWGPTDRVGKPWTLEEIQHIKSKVEAEGLTLHAIENLDPGHWHDVLLDGPQRREQLEQVLESISLLGEAGVPCLGYNFSLAGVWGHLTGPFARGGAESIGFDADAIGAERNNMHLSYRRAQVVREALIRAGIGAERIQAVGRGTEEPLVHTPNHVPEPRNRVVEIRIR